LEFDAERFAGVEHGGLTDEGVRSPSMMSVNASCKFYIKYTELSP
jgi:hypothetical protein